MNSPLLSEADYLRLEAILHPDSTPPRPTHEQRLALSSLLSSATSTREHSLLEIRVGFGDEVILVSPTDPTDDFRLRIVVPHDADPAEGRVSVLAPVSLAILGQENGRIVSWQANGAMRQMRIAEVRKQPDADLAPLSS